MAPRRRHTPEQIIRKLREADRLLGGRQDVSAVAKHLQVSEQMSPARAPEAPQETAPRLLKVVIEEWKNTHNTVRPHSSLGWKTPAVYAASWRSE
jgi:transposase InsO family protein